MALSAVSGAAAVVAKSRLAGSRQLARIAARMALRFTHNGIGSLPWSIL